MRWCSLDGDLLQRLAELIDVRFCLDVFAGRLSNCLKFFLVHSAYPRPMYV